MCKHILDRLVREGCGKTIVYGRQPVLQSVSFPGENLRKVTSFGVNSLAIRVGKCSRLDRGAKVILLEQES